MSRKIGRVLWRTGLALVCLLVVVLLAVQAILSWTNWPRELVVSQIYKQTGLSVSIATLQVSWSGVTTAGNVRLYGSDASRPLLIARTLQVNHAPLWSLALGGSLKLKHVQASGVQIDLVQDAAGRWNAQSLLETFHPPENDRAKPQPLSLPQVDIHQATIHAIFASGQQVILAPVTIHAKNQSRPSGTPQARAGQSLAVELSAGQALQIDGLIQLTGSFEQNLNISINQLVPLNELLPRQWLASNALLNWSGRLATGQLTGLLTIKNLQAGSSLAGGPPLVQADGKVGLSMANRTLLIEPHDLQLVANTWLPDQVLLTQGQAKLDWSTKKFSISDLHAKTLDGQVGLEGEGYLAPVSGQLAASWQKLQLPAGFQQSGSAQIKLRRTMAAGPFQLDAQVHSQGTSPAGQWDGHFLANARGAAWDQFMWSLSLGPSSVSRDETKLTLTDAQWRGRLENGVVILDQFTLPVVSENHGQGQITGSGRYQLGDGRWSLQARATSSRIQENGYQGSARLSFSGTRQTLRGQIEQLTLDDLSGQIQGDLRWGQSSSAQASFSLTVAPPSAADTVTGDGPAVSWKKLSAQGRLAGSLRPLALTLNTQVRAEKLILGSEKSPDTPPASPVVPDNVKTPPSAQIAATPGATSGASPGELALGQTVITRVIGRLTPEKLTLRSLPTDLLQGTVSLEASHSFEDGRTAVKAKVDDLSLVGLDQLMRSALHLKGRASGELTATTRQLKSEDLDVQGQWTVKDFQTTFLSPVQAHGRLLVNKGDVKLIDVTAQANAGKAVGQIHTRLTSMNQFDAKLALTNWPVPLPMDALELRVDGKADLSGNTTTGDFHGPADVKAILFKNQWPFANAKVIAQISRDAVNLNTIHAVFLGGQADGSGRIDLTNLTHSTADLKLSDVNLSLIGLWSSQWSGLKGRAKGEVSLAPTHDIHALGPLRLTVTVEPDTQASVQRVDLGKLDMEVFLDHDRVLLNHLNIQMAKGALSMWGRVSRHGQEWFGFAKAQWQGLSFDQLASLALMFPGQKDQPGAADATAAAGSPSDKVTPPAAVPHEPIPGLFDGQMVVTSSLFDWTRASGHGELSIRKSDLVRVPVFSELYGILNIIGHPEKPKGYGKASFRLEGPSFILTNAAYINRGISINLRLRADDLRRGVKSPLHGLAVVIYNPLPELPLLQGYVDAIMSYQDSATTMSISGSLEHRIIRRVPSSFIGQLTHDLFSNTPETPHATPSDKPAATQPAAEP